MVRIMDTGFIFAVSIPLVVWGVTVARRYNFNLGTEIWLLYTAGDLVSLVMLMFTAIMLRVAYTMFVWEWLCTY